ncbi:hypothetical protein BVH74_12440 [Halopseudomonas phragmitis]|uniref:Response regulatory domain-containing protein n=1 Tax=Halopseudomonas phragmitis TaxID=1931241 RepID=A0A1V0B6J0_9GAMM|nr:hypothetical protein BVH74_12440 [Halopseudomonas phragmitis]
MEFALSYRILIVEDEPVLAENLKAFMEKLPCKAMLATDGARAIDLAGKFPPDLIILDYRLPDMVGFDVLDAVQNTWHGQCVLITGHPTNEVCEEAGKRGITHIMFKPFPLGELRSLVAKMLSVEARSDGNGQVPVERRRQDSGTETFPMRLYDGTWLLADRRHGGKRPEDDDQSPPKPDAPGSKAGKA